MIKNYFNIVIRNLYKNKIFTSINVFGLSIGITCCIVISFYILQETGFDSFHKNSERIYRVALDYTTPDGNVKYGISHAPLAETLKREFPEIEEVTRIFFRDPQSIKGNDKIFFENNVAFADSTFFKVLDFKLLIGEADKVLSSPDNVVISESTAKKYFGDTNPVGQIFRLINYKDFTISGIYEDCPANSHLSFDFIFPYSNMYDENIFSYNLNWGLLAPNYTYILLHENSSVNNLVSKSQNIVAENTELAEGNKIGLIYQPLEDIHLGSEIRADYYFTKNSTSRLVIVATIGIFILSIASINYMNLSTARATKRAKEVGVRKVIGALRGQVILQFLTESVLLTFIAGLIALVLLEIFNPLFSSLLMTKITPDYFSSIWIPISILAFLLMLGIVSGSYPALYLSNIRPIKILNGAIKTNKGGAVLFRKILVVSQFSICILLIIGMVVIQNQLTYMQTAELGFENNHNIEIPLTDNSKGKDYQTIKNRLSEINEIYSISACRYPLIKIGLGTVLFPHMDSNEDEIQASINSVDYDFVEHFNLNLLAGRTFSEEFPNDELNSIIVTKEIVEKLGVDNPQDIIGKTYRVGAWNITGKIIGVVDDFHHRSLHSQKTPVILIYHPQVFRTFLISVKTENIASVLPRVEKIWKEFMPEFPFEYSFLDETIDSYYKQETQTAETISVFALIAIIIGCMGLFGLSAFSVEQKTKEIGIRKVVGASASQIVFLLTKEFTKLIVLANIIAWPIAYYFMDEWLQSYPYRIEMGVRIFILASAVSLIIALVTVSFQSTKAAYANPVKSLENE